MPTHTGRLLRIGELDRAGRPMTRARIDARDRLRALTRARTALNNPGGGGSFHNTHTIASRIRGARDLSIAQRIDLGGDVASRAALAWGFTNPLFTVVLGRNLLHPTGDLNNTQRTTGSVVVLNNPHGGNNINGLAVMLDVPSWLSGQRSFPGQPDTFGARLRSAGAAVSYNFRASFRTGGGIGTTYAPIFVGMGIRFAERRVTPMIARLTAGATELLGVLLPPERAVA